MCLSTDTKHDVFAWGWQLQEGAAGHRDQGFLAALTVGVLGGGTSLCVLCSCWSWIALHIPLPKHPPVSFFVL